MRIAYREGVKKLLSEYRDVVKNEIEEGIRWKRKIKNGKISATDEKKLLKDICGQLLVQGRGSSGVRTQLETIQQWDINNFEREVNNIGMSDRKKQKLREILQYVKNNSISDWINALSLERDNIPRMGPKSDDDFLKSHGFYRHVPIDRHTQRFLFRTGIIHWYFKKNTSKNSKEDILTLFGGSYEEKYRLFQKILVEFCEAFCTDICLSSPVGKLRISENPGLIDIVIWRHCGEDKEYGCKNICGSKPKCKICVFKETCLWNISYYTLPHATKV